jgi:argininosuccinate lyase
MDRETTLPIDEDLSHLRGSLAPGQFYRRDGARLSGEADPSLLKVSSTSDEFHEAYHDFDRAHAVMLTESGILPDGVGEDLLDGLDRLESEGLVDRRERSGYGCHVGEAYLIAELGEDIGGWIHVGRSTRDLREVARRVVAREKVLDLLDACLSLCETYAERAGEYADAVFPTYTRFQHAQVTTFGAHLLSLERPLERDVERLWGAYTRLNVSPAGTASGTGTDFAIDRETTADLLGFDGVADSATAVDKSSDVHLEASFAPVFVLHDVAVAAESFLLWSGQEYGLVDFPDDLCGTSSIMPQKKNPLGLVVVKNRVNDAIGAATRELVASRSFGDRGSVALSALDDAREAVQQFETLLSRLSFDREAGEALVYDDWALATDLAGFLVRDADVPWRTAHQITAILCRAGIEAGVGITDVDADDVDAAAEAYLGREVAVDPSGLAETLDATRAVEARADLPGSPAPSRTREGIGTTEEFVEHHRERAATVRGRLADANDRLEARGAEIRDGT